MVIVRIEHRVPNSAGWEHAFDRDPVGRQQSGVRRSHMLRSLDDLNDVLIDLAFGTNSEAEALLAALREVWGRVEGRVMWSPQARNVEGVESNTY